MSFLDDAKAVLNTEKLNRLELLARKSADFDTTAEEDKEFLDLKVEVKKQVADRDRQKNLEFLKAGAYSLADILKAMGVDKKAVATAVKEVFPDTKPVVVPFAGVLATYEGKEYKLVGTTRDFTKKIRESGIATFVANLTPEGKAWLLENRKKDRGTGVVYVNIQPIATRFDFKKPELMAELTKPEQVKEEEVATSKPKPKH